MLWSVSVWTCVSLSLGSHIYSNSKLHSVIFDRALNCLKSNVCQFESAERTAVYNDLLTSSSCILVYHLRF